MMFAKNWSKAALITAVVLLAPLAQSEEAKEEVKKMESLEPEFKKSASYSLGARYGQAIKADFGEELDLDQLVEGFSHVLTGKELKVNPEKLQADLLQLQQIRTNRLEKERAVLQDKNKQAADDFLAKNKTADGVKTTESGLQYKVVKEGEGESPAKSDKVKVHYHGTFLNGDVFDSSIERGTPAEFPVGGVIEGWTEALQLMVPGDKWVLYVPPHLAYKERGTPGGPIGPNQALIFEVELLSVEG